MAENKSDVLQGTLDLMILKTLESMGSLHGYGIAQSIRRTTDEAIQVEACSLYPSLQRLELQGLLTARWEESERGPRTRVYRLTAAGRKRLHAEVSRWEDFVRAVSLVLKPKAVEE